MTVPAPLNQSSDLALIQSEFWQRFHPVEFIAYLRTGFKCDAHGQLQLHITIPQEYVEDLLPNICYTAGVPLKFSISAWGDDDD